jgi:hypothetical protein
MANAGSLVNKGLTNRTRVEDDDDKISVPSDLSKDEWAEIVDFNKKKFELDKQKEKEKNMYKKRDIKANLDRQLQEKRK